MDAAGSKKNWNAAQIYSPTFMQFARGISQAFMLEFSIKYLHTKTWLGCVKSIKTKSFLLCITSRVD